MFSPRRNSPGTFYESFSDLIFGTLAVFILLFVLILALLRPPPEPPPAPKAVELVVAIDMSASMTEPYAELRVALEELSKHFPKIIKDFSIGIVVYREDLPQRAEVFELEVMNPQTSRQLISWLGKRSPSGGVVDPGHGIRLATSMLKESAGKENVVRSLVLIGDVGPYESAASNGGALWEFTSQDARDREASIYATVSDFSASEENFFLSMYTFELARGNEPHRPSSKNFFCTLAKSAGVRGRFAEERGDMVWVLLETFLEKSEAVDTSDSLPDCS